ncbi:hypothetical protein AB0H42_10390 [Nocardia sp. NPDC050799]|uniref:hypothetical protein n=1 Tax=Nocardia sp. NPDC050799 TaxID=3154842 RepID=UPI0033E893A1
MSNKSDIDAAREYYETHSVVNEINNSVPGNPADTSPMSGYSVRLPTEVLNQARELAAERGMTTGAWLREAIEKQIAVGRPRDREAVRWYGESAVDTLFELLTERFTDMLRSCDTAPASAIDPSLSSWKTHMLRDWNAAHLRDLYVLSLISGGGIDRWIAPRYSKPEKTGAAAGKKKRAVKVSGRSHLLADSVIRDGHTVRVKDSSPAGRRRRRSST